LTDIFVLAEACRKRRYEMHGTVVQFEELLYICCGSHTICVAILEKELRSFI